MQDLDAAGKGATVPEKVRELGRADRKDREASNQADKEVFCFRKKFRKQNQTPAMQQAKNKTVPVKVPEPLIADSRDAAGKAVGVNGRYVSEEVQGRLCAKVHISKRKQLDKQ